MAYIVSTQQTAIQNTGTTYAVSFPSGVLANDLIVVLLSQDGSTESLGAASSGFTAIGTQTETPSAAASSLCFYKIAAGGETSATFACANDDIIGTAILIRDAHATAPFGTVVDGTDYKRFGWNAVSSAASNKDGDLTSAVDECLLLYAWTSDGSTRYMRCPIADCIEVDKYATTLINHIVGARQQQTAGVAPTATMYDITAAEGGNGWVLAVRNKSGGALQPDVRATCSEVKWYGAWEVTHDAVTWQSPSNFAANIPPTTGYACSTTTPTVGYTNAWTDSPWGQYSNIPNTNAVATNDWSGATHTISSTDMTGKVFSVEVGAIAQSTSTVTGSEGMLIGFSDGTNWVTYQIASKAKGYQAGTPQRVAIALGNSVVYASEAGVGAASSIDWGAVTRIAYLHHRTGNATLSQGFQIKNACLLDKIALTGGGSSRPATLQDINTYLNSWGHYQHTLQQASAQVLVKNNVQIGDGTNKTYFDGAAQSIEFPQAWSASRIANWQMFWNAGNSAVSLKVKASASDTIKLAAGVAATDTLQALTIDSGSATTSDGAVFDFGQSFVGWSPTWKTGVTCANATFSACAPVAFKGANVTSCIIKNTLATASEAAITFDANGATVTTSTIDVTGTSAGYHIALGASVTAITLNGVTLTGTPGTDKIYSALASGTLTITADGTGTGLVAGDVTFIGGSTATAVIASPQVYQTVTISGATAGSRIQVYDTTSSTELYNGTPAFPYTWTDGSAAAADRAIRLRVAYVSGATAKEFIEANIGTCGQTSGTAAVSYLVNQVADTTYDTNAIDGPTIYATSGITFTDAATDLVNCNIAGGAVTWPTIYACFVYWLSTSTGIADDITYISAPDPANYLLTAMKIKNTNANPLTITGGFGRSATSGLVADIIDTAGSTGNIFPAPDHVVAYATGSALTAGQDAKLTAIDAVCTSFVFTSGAVQADIQRVNGYEVTGDGQTGTEWGPV